MGRVLSFGLFGPSPQKKQRKGEIPSEGYKTSLPLLCALPLSVETLAVDEIEILSFSANMKVVAAYCLAQLGGNSSPSADDIKSILGAVGIEADDEKIELLLTQVKGKDFAELIASGREKLAAVPSGGGAVAVAAPAGGAAAGGAAPAAEAKEEKKVEEKEESDDDMGFSLFD